MICKSAVYIIAGFRFGFVERSFVFSLPGLEELFRVTQSRRELLPSVGNVYFRRSIMCRQVISESQLKRLLIFQRLSKFLLPFSFASEFNRQGRDNVEVEFTDFSRDFCCRQ